MDDLPAIYQMAKSTGGGFTNLPPHRPALKARLQRTVAAFTREEDALGDDLFLFILEDIATGEARGTCQIFSQIGTTWPFYNYRLDSFSNYSKELDRTVSAEMLTLSTDLNGSSEVGGLYLHPNERSTGAGALLARSRYLFMKLHRARFADRTIAELRGAHDDTGGSPFWDAIAGRFFGMSFREADEFNAINGNQFIADLMPKHPIYKALLPPNACAVIGVPHHSGRAAKRMLENEGFIYDRYIDIFDGGPAMAVATDAIATLQEARTDAVTSIAAGIEDGAESIVALGRLGDFRACYGSVESSGSSVTVDKATAEALRITVGDRITHVKR